MLSKPLKIEFQFLTMEAEAMAGGPPGRNYLMTKNDVIKRAVELIW